MRIVKSIEWSANPSTAAQLEVSFAFYPNGTLGLMDSNEAVFPPGDLERAGYAVIQASEKEWETLRTNGFTLQSVPKAAPSQEPPSNSSSRKDDSSGSWFSTVVEFFTDLF